METWELSCDYDVVELDRRRVHLYRGKIEELIVLVSCCSNYLTNFAVLGVEVGKDCKKLYIIVLGNDQTNHMYGLYYLFMNTFYHRKWFKLEFLFSVFFDFVVSFYEYILPSEMVQVRIFVLGVFFFFSLLFSKLEPCSLTCQLSPLFFMFVAQR